LNNISSTHPPVRLLSGRLSSAQISRTLENLRLTPEERIRKLDSFIKGVSDLKASVRVVDPTNCDVEQHH
jgi:hypothetical protein